MTNGVCGPRLHRPVPGAPDGVAGSGLGGGRSGREGLRLDRGHRIGVLFDDRGERPVSSSPTRTSSGFLCA